MMTTMDNMTEKEKKVVEELERRTINDVTPKMLEDVSVFYRFAKARDFNLVEAESMLRKHISWRKEMEIDTILTDYEPLEALVKFAPTSFICFDKEGCLVRLIDMGRADMKGLWSLAKKPDWVKLCCFIVEQDIERVIKRGGNLGKPMYLIIEDYENLTYANALNLKSIQFFIFFLKTFFDNYPEVLRSVALINGPSALAWFYAAIKPIVPAAVVQKVRIYGTDGWQEVLSREIDSDDLPAYLGGNRTDPDGNPLCETFIRRGQPIPKSYYMQNERKKLALESDVGKITVMPLSKEEICFEVKETNSYLQWEFQTNNRDINFSLLFRSESSEDLEPVVLLPKQRIDTRDEPEKGCFKCDKVGNYGIVFDNSYSWIHSKEVFYRAGMTTQLIDGV